MTLIMLAALDCVFALVFGFVVGRMWQIRRYELERRDFTVSIPPIAHIQRL